MATMQVILAKKMEGLGAEADLVTVKAGYGRNYLIPQGLAHEATKSNRRYINALQVSRAKREAEELASFQEIAAQIAKLTVNLKLDAGQEGKVFGAVTNQDIHDELVALGVEIDRHSIELEKPIKTSGTYDIIAKLHPQVAANIKLIVKIEGEVAKPKQAATTGVNAEETPVVNEEVATK